jgi:hypothetical protein
MTPEQMLGAAGKVHPPTVLGGVVPITTSLAWT